jgi:hypothetical protein
MLPLGTFLGGSIMATKAVRFLGLAAVALPLALAGCGMFGASSPDASPTGSGASQTTGLGSNGPASNSGGTGAGNAAQGGAGSGGAGAGGASGAGGGAGSK